MASYQARGRDPLFDKNTQAILERRGRELVGIGLLLGAVIMALMLGSYLPEDPSWLSATDAPVNNAFGRLGASIASPLMIIVGTASWGISAVFAVWGVRFITHRGAERSLSRVVFAPISIALIAVYASTYASVGVQSHGGLFGDTVLSALIQILPITPALALKSLAFVTFFAAVTMTLFVFGFTRQELNAVGRFMLYGLIGLYSLILHATGKAARGSVATGQRLAATNAERRAEKQRILAENQALVEAEQAVAPRVVRAEAHQDDVLEQPEPTEYAEKSGLFSKMPTLLKRSPDVSLQPELVEPELAPEPDMGGGFDDRIRSKISNVVNARVRAGSRAISTTGGRVEPPLSAAQAAVAKYKKGPKPMIFSQPAPSVAAETGARFDDPATYTDEALAYADDSYTDEGYAEGYDEAPTGYAPVDYDDDIALDTPEYVAPNAARYEPAVTAPEPKRVVQHPVRKPAVKSKQAQAEAQPALKFDPKEAEYQRPPLSLLESGDTVERFTLSDDALEENARMLENVLDDYGVKGEIVSVRPGPVVTMYELEPAPGLKASRVIGLADDIARSMSALSARVSTVPGRTVIGIELPNENREKVVLREILSARDFGDSNMKLPLALGKDIGGDPIVANLAKMPHLLIAGTTGSGKSVAINTMILSLLYKLTPDECRMIMIDPKMLELSVYDGIPHLLSPVVTDPKKAVVALKWTVAEMEDRYRKMSKMGVRNIDGYNGRVKEALAKDEMFSRTVQTGFDEETGDPIFETEEFKPETIPYIVVIVDEMADLMMVAGKEIEACIQRLAQMARASGIHIIMATQRPSVDVITGTIKANFPTRISFQVSSKIDSRTILGEQGAEQLLGMGDMLYMAGGSKITRVHGPFCSDEEVEKIVSYLKSYGPPSYVGGVVEGPPSDKESSIDAVLGLSSGGNTDTENALYDTAVAIVIKDRKCSTSYIQRKLAIGYNKAARLVEQMEDEGVVSAANHVGKREILVPEQ
ncbi:MULTISPECIES: DNA translocase FtsK [Pacificibacter]|uniref:DNA translocase FtsK n=1 Tax=Pacificibacter TaxID=1042323 RepID=UPI001C087113|nr:MULTISPECIES: DNA translocase FtsK [Pacificibacter]MBU2936002.1 DNA translocase FtsK 4TM domain-containing protein [Pacificibacter marinus]MDO6615149.1 DNA translocase FtsK 4TM domain-containing protein [Pacificibacter sp. 1_MG-2023]